MWEVKNSSKRVSKLLFPFRFGSSRRSAVESAGRKVLDVKALSLLPQKSTNSFLRLIFVPFPFILFWFGEYDSWIHWSFMGGCMNFDRLVGRSRNWGLCMWTFVKIMCLLLLLLDCGIKHGALFYETTWWIKYDHGGLCVCLHHFGIALSYCPLLIVSSSFCSCKKSKLSTHFWPYRVKQRKDRRVSPKI